MKFTNRFVMIAEGDENDSLGNGQVERKRRNPRIIERTDDGVSDFLNYALREDS